MSSIKNFYQILQIDPSAEPEVITAAFRGLAKRYHPDVNRSVDATQRMRELNEAYEKLSNPAKRAQYDLELQQSRIKARAEKRDNRPSYKQEPQNTQRSQAHAYAGEETRRKAEAERELKTQQIKQINEKISSINDEIQLRRSQVPNTSNQDILTVGIGILIPISGLLLSALANDFMLFILFFLLDISVLGYLIDKNNRFYRSKCLPIVSVIRQKESDIKKLIYERGKLYFT